MACATSKDEWKQNHVPMAITVLQLAPHYTEQKVQSHRNPKRFLLSHQNEKERDMRSKGQKPSPLSANVHNLEFLLKEQPNEDFDKRTANNTTYKPIDELTKIIRFLKPIRSVVVTVIID